jgi:hypothetical protein
LFFDGEEWLGTGRVYNENINPPEDVRHLMDQADNLDFATHIRFECMAEAAGLPNALAELFGRVAAIEVVDGDVRTERSLL